MFLVLAIAHLINNLFYLFFIRMYSRAARITVQNARAFSGGAPTKPPVNSSSSPSTSAINANVKGLSSKIVIPKSQPLGPGAATDGHYKVPEYYCYNRTSYYEAEVELAPFRCPQPSAVKK